MAIEPLAKPTVCVGVEVHLVIHTRRHDTSRTPSGLPHGDRGVRFRPPGPLPRAHVQRTPRLGNDARVVILGPVRLHPEAVLRGDPALAHVSYLGANRAVAVTNNDALPVIDDALCDLVAQAARTGDVVNVDSDVGHTLIGQ